MEKAFIRYRSIKNVEVKSSPQKMVFVKVTDITRINTQPTSLQIEWNELNFSINSAQEAVLTAKLIKELRSIC